jgi:hypothetical protein
MPRNHKTSASNGHSNAIAKKSKDKPTYKIIVLGSGGVGKVSFGFSSYTPPFEKCRSKLAEYDVINLPFST